MITRTEPAQVPSVAAQSPSESAARYAAMSAPDAAAELAALHHSIAVPILAEFDLPERQAIVAAAPEYVADQWNANLFYGDDMVGRLMELPQAVFGPDMTVTQAVEELRQIVKRAFVTYIYVVDSDLHLIGVVVMREMLLAEDTATLGELMISHPFSLRPDMTQIEAMRAVIGRHYPAYPVCNAEGVLVGLLRGQTLFERQAIELSAQAGSMVGVEKEERLGTPWRRSLKFRHPWLQLNLLTAFVAAAVVGVFQDTIDRIVVLAVFLPVLAGQSGNTGCQALAVALRAMTMGELVPGKGIAAVAKEALLGLVNGALVGLTAGVGMYVYAAMRDNEAAVWLGLIVAVAMTGSCIISGVTGVLVPLALKRMGADPATASSIFLTTATDVASMGMFLGLATLLI